MLPPCPPLAPPLLPPCFIQAASLARETRRLAKELKTVEVSLGRSVGEQGSATGRVSDLPWVKRLIDWLPPEVVTFGDSWGAAAGGAGGAAGGAADGGDVLDPLEAPGTGRPANGTPPSLNNAELIALAYQKLDLLPAAPAALSYVITRHPHVIARLPSIHEVFNQNASARSRSRSAFHKWSK